MKDRDGKATLSVRVIPRSGTNQVTVSDDMHVTVRTTSPPADGKANQSVIEILARALDIPKSCIYIKSGATSRNKVISFLAVDEAILLQKIRALSKISSHT